MPQEIAAQVYLNGVDLWLPLHSAELGTLKWRKNRVGQINGFSPAYPSNVSHDFGQQAIGFRGLISPEQWPE